MSFSPVVITWDIKNGKQFKSAFMILNYFIDQYLILSYYFNSKLHQWFYSEHTEKYLHLLKICKVLKLFMFNNCLKCKITDSYKFEVSNCYGKNTFLIKKYYAIFLKDNFCSWRNIPFDVIFFKRKSITIYWPFLSISDSYFVKYKRIIKTQPQPAKSFNLVGEVANSWNS